MNLFFYSPDRKKLRILLMQFAHLQCKRFLHLLHSWWCPSTPLLLQIGLLNLCLIAFFRGRIEQHLWTRRTSTWNWRSLVNYKAAEYILLGCFDFLSFVGFPGRAYSDFFLCVVTSWNWIFRQRCECARCSLPVRNNKLAATMKPAFRFVTRS